MTKLQTIFKTTSESINDFINDVSFEKIASKYSLRA
jgi:t-SNARE complex subunit (syntaxin)